MEAGDPEYAGILDVVGKGDVAHQRLVRQTDVVPLRIGVALQDVNGALLDTVHNEIGRQVPRHSKNLASAFA
jgi:hypothetical protein